MSKIKQILFIVFIHLTGLALAQAPGTWTVNLASYSYQMTMTCRANEACVDLEDTSNIIAAFVGTQCRGVVKTKTTAGGFKLGLLTIESNAVSGEKVHFQVYKASTNTILNILDSANFVQGTQLGALANPVILYTNHPVTGLHIAANSISENKPISTLVTNLTATDVDAGTIFSYSLTNGQPENAQFQISSSQLLSNVVFDYEVDSVKVIEITVNDNGGCSYTSTFTIDITNVNDTPTVINIALQTISDHQQAGSFVGKFSTVDEDFHDAHSYSLVSGLGSVDNGQFYIHHDTLYNVSQIDFTAQSVYHFRARSTDLGGLFVEDTFVVNIVNVNDAPTNILLSNFTLAENKPVNTTIGTFTTIDADVADTHTLTLEPGTGGGDNNKVSIFGDTLKTNAVYNFEQQDSLHVKIRTTDPAGAYYVKTFTIVVTDVNETPTNIILSNDTIKEGLPISTTVGTFTSTDEDFVDTHAYTLVTGTGDTDNTLFTITSNSIVTTATFSYTAQTYSVRVRTTDSGNLFYEKAFNIVVKDSNYVPTNIIPSTTSFNENIAIDTKVLGFTTIDYDATDTHTLTLVNGAGSTDNAYFSITGDSLQTDSTINFEKKNIYYIRVTSTDPGNASVTKTFTLTVNDLNEVPTNILLSNDTVKEGLPISTIVGTFTSTDEDLVDTHAYTLVTGVGDTDNALFTITSNSIVTAVTYSYTAQTYSVRVRTTDSGNLFYEKAFNIVVKDSNYVPTNIIPSTTSFNENIAIGTKVLGFTTIDYDATDTHTLTLVSGAGSTDNAYFSITGDSLQTDSTINFEKKNVYYIRVTSTDPGNASVTKTFTLTVNDLNEAPTDISLSADSIIELQPAGTLIGNLASTDEDLGDTHTYALVAGVGGTDNSLFTIAGNQLQSNITYTFTNQTYSVRIQSMDAGGLTFEKIFSVKILNENQAPTDIVLDTAFVNEDNVEMFHVTQIKTIDPDSGDTFTYSLVAGTGDTDNDEFAVENDNLIILHKTNHDVKPVYHIRLKSKDAGGLSVQKAFDINIVKVASSSIPLPSTNYISPNGDGKNDFWMIDNVEIYKDFQLQVFDQFGQIIYSVPNNYNNEFDGTYKGNALPTGNYYYIFKNDNKTFKGNITIVN